MLFITFILSSAYAGWFFPEQVRLSWTENENEMRATWVTFFQAKK